MNSLNSIILEGNLVKDPEVGTTKTGTPVTVFTIACNRSYKSEDAFVKEVSYFTVETWSKLAENCGTHLSKGRGVRIVGRLKQDRWTDSEGKNHTSIKIVAEHVEFKPQAVGKNETEENHVEFPEAKDETEKPVTRKKKAVG
jgi:single-strand DNA-binding protein